MDSRSKSGSGTAPFGAPLHWNPVQAILPGGLGLYFVVSSLSWHSADSAVEFWTRVVLGLVLIRFDALGIRALRGGARRGGS